MPDSEVLVASVVTLLEIVVATVAFVVGGWTIGATPGVDCVVEDVWIEGEVIVVEDEAVDCPVVDSVGSFFLGTILVDVVTVLDSLVEEVCALCPC